MHLKRENLSVYMMAIAVFCPLGVEAFKAVTHSGTVSIRRGDRQLFELFAASDHNDRLDTIFSLRNCQ